MRIQFDCVQRAHRVLRYTVFSNNNLKNELKTQECGDSCTWRPDHPGASYDADHITSSDPDLSALYGGLPRNTSYAHRISWYDVLRTTVCARTAPQSAEGK
jgi:hypothetical protein